MPFTNPAQRGAWDRQRANTLKEAGVCVICRSASSGAVYCLRCARRRAQNRAAIRAARFARGVCATCPHAVPAGEKRCIECRYRDSLNNAKQHAKRTAARAAEIRQDMPRLVGSGRPVAP
jgi:hypothetical protein